VLVLSSDLALDFEAPDDAVTVTPNVGDKWVGARGATPPSPPEMLAPSSDLAPNPDAPDDAATVTPNVGPKWAPAETAATRATAMLAKRPVPFPEFDRTKFPDRQKPAKDPAKKPNPGLAYQYYCSSEKKRCADLAECDGDKPSGKPPPAGLAQREALDKRDVLEAILRNLGCDTYHETGKTAARWCALNKAHRAARKTHAPWKDLTQAVFPGVRAPNASNHEPTHPMDWFFFLCDRHAQFRKRNVFGMHSLGMTEKYIRLKAMSDAEWAAPYLEKIEEVHRQRKEANQPGILVTPDDIGGYKRALQYYKTKARGRQDAMKETLKWFAVTHATEDDPAKWMGQLAQLGAWLRGLYNDPDVDPYAPVGKTMGCHWQPEHAWGLERMRHSLRQ